MFDATYFRLEDGTELILDPANHNTLIPTKETVRSSTFRMIPAIDGTAGQVCFQSCQNPFQFLQELQLGGRPSVGDKVRVVAASAEHQSHMGKEFIITKDAWQP